MSAGTGHIVISSDTDTRFIDVSDAGQVRFGAPGYNSRNPYFQNREEFGVVTINPSTDLLLDTTYTIQVADGVFLDSKGNPHPGFNNAPFKTVDSSYPSNPTTYPHSFNNASIASGANGSNSSIRLLGQVGSLSRVS
ncbi:MAG: hypothetical protein KA343_06485, partial [Nitrosomonas sp.]|nr:hypothetical protein [Nitrosomonas sp.]